MSTFHEGKIRGSILAGALGDAAGSTDEGSARKEINRLVVGPITDDTQLTLATCESIITTGQVSPEHIAATFVKWHRARRFTGLGASTLKALTELEAGQHWALSGAKGERAAGNGAAMRIAPLAYCLDPFDDTDRRTIRDVCRITHHHDEAYIGALAIVLAIRALAFDSMPLADMPNWVAQQLPDSQVRDRLSELAKFGPRPIADVAERYGNSGFVVDSVPLALFSAARFGHEPLESTLLQLIATGGDADTNASLAGQLIGASRGEDCLPAGTLKQLSLSADERRIIDRFANQFA
jgi:ADP-ribosylglycohydrolase